jgi:cytochrome c553
MAVRIPVVVSLSLIALGASFAVPKVAQAQTPPAFTGDAKRGHALSYTCNGCHGVPNYKNVYPTYSVPKLHNQRPEYIVAALKAYKSGERDFPTMRAIAGPLTDDEMKKLADFMDRVLRAPDDSALLDRIAAEVKPIEPALHEARESIWTPEKEQPAETPKLWTPGT